MIFLKTKFFQICFLVFYLAQNCFGHIHTAQQQKCIDQIKKIFKVYDKPYEIRKTYAEQAYLLLRISDSNVNDDTFTNPENNSKYEDAMAYYKHILEPGHLVEGPLIKLPENFCQQKKGSRKRKIPTNNAQINPTGLIVYNTCMNQLSRNRISLSDNGLEVIKSIYENVVKAKVDPQDEYALEFIELNRKGFRAIRPMKLPQGFCDHKYPGALEFSGSNK